MFYIGRRDNPQFKKPYYLAYGKLTKAAARKKTESMYGSVTLESYSFEMDYRTRVAELLALGYRVIGGKS